MQRGAMHLCGSRFGNLELKLEFVIICNCVVDAAHLFLSLNVCHFVAVASRDVFVCVCVCMIILLIVCGAGELWWMPEFVAPVVVLLSSSLVVCMLSRDSVSRISSPPPLYVR
jgi:hypothetical protein